MAQIFHRATLISGVAKKKNDKNRKRNIILNFRVSEEEKRLIEKGLNCQGWQKRIF